MHSFFLARHFKLDAIDFGRVVFNTEAHPLPRTWCPPGGSRGE